MKVILSWKVKVKLCWSLKSEINLNAGKWSGHWEIDDGDGDDGDNGDDSDSDDYGDGGDVVGDDYYDDDDIGRYSKNLHTLYNAPIWALCWPKLDLYKKKSRC